MATCFSPFFKILFRTFRHVAVEVNWLILLFSVLFCRRLRSFEETSSRLFKQLPRCISLEQREIDGSVSRFLLSASLPLTEDGVI